MFFQSVSEVVLRAGYTDAKFADDLSALKAFPSAIQNDVLLAGLHPLQALVHEWGVANRVVFDTSKEHFVILHRLHNSGDSFKLLGVLVDTKLVMCDEVRRIREKASPKAHAILATRQFYDVAALLRQFKAHVWCHLEPSIVAIYHASDSP